MKKLNLLLSYLLLLLAFTAEAKSPPPGTGKADVPANILIMLDVSGSMSSQTNTSKRLYYPTDTAVDSKGNIFVSELYYHRIKKYDSAGKLLKTIGGYEGRTVDSYTLIKLLLILVIIFMCQTIETIEFKN